MISRFHYLTQDLEGVSHPELAFRACERGVRWVQFRSKVLRGEALREAALAVKKVTDFFAATLIINDHVELALETNACGVHLGKDDMEIEAARELLGTKKIVGGTANSVDDVKRLRDSSVSYLGVGPYRFTRTKENLSPVLGSVGLQSLIASADSHVPLIAIGGIGPADVPELFSLGVHGVAVSSAAHVLNSKSALPDFIRLTAKELENATYS